MPTPSETVSPIVIGPDGSIRDQVVTPEEAEFLRGWQPSSHPTGKDEAESERVGRKIRAIMKQCWFNARRVVLRLDEYTEASYIEGYAFSKKGFPPFEHGWVVRDGVIIDPTLPTSIRAYFPGLEFVGRAGIEEFLRTEQGKRCRKSPFLYAFGWGGQDSPSMGRAYRDSYDYFLAFHSKG
jgi:hypothetical protein